MSNVAIVATDEIGLEVDVCLGDNVRKTHKVDAGGDALELTVAGNQTLVVRASYEAAPTAEAEGDLPVGVDVSDETDADGQPNPPAPVGESALKIEAPAAGQVVDASEAGQAAEALKPGVDFFPEDGQPVPPTDDQDPATVTNGSGEVGGEQGDLFDNPFEKTDA